MKSLKLIPLLSLCMIFILTGCQKQPKASFVTDKTEYVAGETVYLTNTSIDADHYEWTFPGGITATDFQRDYVINPYSIIPGDIGPLTFKLKAYSKNGSKSDEVSQTVYVRPAKGSVVFWQQTGSGYGITNVTINGVTSSITSEYGSTPSCGASGCAVFDGLKIGTYNYTATDGTTTWSGTITITPDGCASMELI